MIFIQSELNLSGSSRSLEALFKLLNPSKVITFNSDPLFDYLPIKKIRGGKITRNYKSIYYFLLGFFTTFKELYSKKDEVILINSLISTQWLFSSILLKRRLGPVIIIVRENELTYNKFFYKVHTVLANLCASRLVFVSEKVVNSNFDSNKVSIIPNYINTKGLIDCNSNNYDVVGIFPINNAKGADIWLKLIKFYLKNSLVQKVLLIGKSQTKSLGLKIQALKSQFPNSFSYQEKISDVSLILSSCKFLLHCSRFEALPRVVMESCFYGCIPVAYNIGGTSDLIPEKIKPQLITNSCDYKSFKSIFNECLKLSDEEIENIVNDNKEHIKENFSQQKIEYLWKILLAKI